MSRAKVWIPALVLLAGCGGFIGLSPEHPLGEYDEIDTYLAADRTFKRSDDRIRHAECFDDEALLERLEEMTVVKYLEVSKGTKAGEVQVKVVRDGSGKVVAVVGRFFSHRAIWSDAGGMAETFIARMWLEVSGGEATFTKKDRPGGMLDEYLLAEFDDGTLAGRWEKIPTMGNASHTKTLRDQVLIYVK